jgi:hypothetical protein
MWVRGRSWVRAPLWCACVGALLPVRVLVRLHIVAMHDNTKGMERISTHG